MQLLQAAAVTTKIIGLLQYARIRDRGRCKVSHASTARLLRWPVTWHQTQQKSHSCDRHIWTLFDTDWSTTICDMKMRQLDDTDCSTTICDMKMRPLECIPHSKHFRDKLFGKKKRNDFRSNDHFTNCFSCFAIYFQVTLQLCFL